ncbi:MAG: Asp-tRNA(Asn)/Glu-tRNA(Gln) amidotransferase subunit GatC [Candidatus Paceibacterota bacterium]|jgi:aspartyl-tRNA(Asn)/glutamyl-tRNA(Gln) amidotransferase subunit C
MDKLINKKTLEHLAELSRIKLDEKEEQKLLKDLEEILEYFNLLKEVDTENIKPLSGGTIKQSVFRGAEAKNEFKKEKLTEQFLENKDDYLKIPPVFE